MKFLHLGDLHLGRSLADFDLIEDQRYILDRIIEMAKEHCVDGIIIAGDVYDKSIPSEAATRLLDSFLSELASLRVKVFMISGNHDSDDRLAYGSGLFSSSGIYISSIYEGKLAKYTLEDEYGPLDVYLMPFVKASRVRNHFHDANIETYDDAVRLIIENSDVDKERRNLIAAHQFVMGKGQAGDMSDPLLAGSESAGTKTVGLVEKIGWDCFDAFDYVALGHIHSPQRVGRDECRYAGSPLKYSLGEAEGDKSVPLITFGAKGCVDIELLPLKPRRDMRHIRGPLKKLLDKDNIFDTEDFIYATLTDEDLINDCMGILRQVYPNTVRIDYDNSHTKETMRADISKITETKAFPELLKDFYSLIYGNEISEEELNFMEEIAREAGIKDEAH